MAPSQRRIAYIDATAGVSGDMLLGALVDAGVELAALRRGLRGLGLLGLRLSARQVERAGIRGTQVVVRTARHRLTPAQMLTAVRRCRLPETVRASAAQTLRRLFEAERAVHPAGRLHLEELAEPDTVVDIVGAIYGFHLLDVSEITASAVNTGSGWIETRHGRLPVPTPATSALLLGIPIFSTGEPAELTTPTGAALVRKLARRFGPLPALTPSRIGSGAGERELSGRPNLLRLFLGTAPSADPPPQAEDSAPLVMVETNIDDMNPQAYTYVMDRLYAAGALEAYLTAVIMKKGRPGTVVNVLTPQGTLEAVTRVLFEETTTLGIRFHDVRRLVLERRILTVTTRYGRIRVKVAAMDGRVVKYLPEYEDCRRAAARHGVSLLAVMEAARRRATPTR